MSLKIVLATSVALLSLLAAGTASAAVPANLDVPLVPAATSTMLVASYDEFECEYDDEDEELECDFDDDDDDDDDDDWDGDFEVEFEIEL